MINHKLETLTILLILTIAVSAVPCVWAASTYSMTVSYSTSDKEPILEPPVLQYIDASGKSQDFTLTQTPTKIDMKKNSEWSITPKGTITVSASERWVSSNKTWSGKTPSSGGSDTNIWVYTHQYKVTFNVDPLKGGSTEPTGEVWYAADSSGNPLSASPNTNYAFKVWKATKSISIADPESSHTTFRVYGAGEITALFQTETAAAETALNITCTPTTVDTNGNMQTTLTGKLTLASNSNIGISGKTITLSYFDGASWNTISTVTTGVQGSYTFDWQVPATLPYGFHPVKATFAGDCQYEPQEAITTEGSEGIFVLPEYALGAFAALAACFAALTVFSVRKTKQ